MKKMGFILGFVILVIFLHGPVLAQNDSPQGKSYVKIKTMKIINGDTIITEKEYTGDENMVIQDTMIGDGFYGFNFDNTQPVAQDNFMKQFFELQNMFNDFNFGMNDFPDFYKGFSPDSIINEFRFHDFDSLFPEMNNYNMILKRFKDPYHAHDSILNKPDSEMRMHLYGRDENRNLVEMNGRILIQNSDVQKENNSAKSSLKINVFPNPADTYFNLSFMLDPKNKTVITLTDARGKTMLKESVNKAEGMYTRNFNMESYSKGSYFINIKQGKKSATRKIMIS